MNKLSKKIFIKSKRSIKKLQKIYLMIAISTVMFIYNVIPISAAGTDTGGGKFGDSIFATGTKNLFNDIGIYLVVLAPIAGGVLGTYFFIRRGAADEMDQSAATRCC